MLYHLACLILGHDTTDSSEDSVLHIPREARPHQRATGEPHQLPCLQLGGHGTLDFPFEMHRGVFEGAGFLIVFCIILTMGDAWALTSNGNCPGPLSLIKSAVPARAAQVMTRASWTCTTTTVALGRITTTYVVDCGWKLQRGLGGLLVRFRVRLRRAGRLRLHGRLEPRPRNVRDVLQNFPASCGFCVVCDEPLKEPSIRPSTRRCCSLPPKSHSRRGSLRAGSGAALGGAAGCAN